MSTDLPAPSPHVTFETAPFWEAATDGRLVLPRCDECGTVIWYPRQLCPDCGSTTVSWFEASGRGTVYSFTVVRKGQGPYREAAPYVVAYVELEEGPRMMTNIVGCDPDAVRVDMPVRVTFAPTEKGTALPRFSPV